MQLIVVVCAFFALGAQGQNLDTFANPFDEINAKFSEPKDEAAADLKEAREDLATAVKKSTMAKDQLDIASQDYRGSKLTLAQRHEQEAAELKNIASSSLKRGMQLLSEASDMHSGKITLADNQLET